jgi:hypothetical protein
MASKNSTGTGVVHHCRRPGCRRPLTSPASIAAGMGPTCARRARAEADAIAAACEGFKPEQVAKAKAAIRDGKVRRMANGLYLVTSSRTDEKYCSDGSSCACPAGARSRTLRCWHLLAVRIAEILGRRPAAARPLGLAA